MERTIKQKVRELMEFIIPDLPEMDEHTLLADVGFDDFCKDMLSYDLEINFTICIPDLEVDHWQTFGDILETVYRYQH